MSAPESVRTKDGMVWTLRTVTSSGIALYAPKGVCECPAFVMATLAELAEHGIQSAELAAAVAEHGAFPVPVGPVPQELPAERLTEIAARTQAATAGPWWTDTLAESDGSESIGVDAGDDNWIVPCQDLDPADAEFIAHARADVPALLTEIGRLTAQRDRRRTRLVALQNDALNMRGALSLNGEDRKVPFPLGPTLLPAVEWLIARVAELEAERAGQGVGCSCPPADHPHQVGCLRDEAREGEPTDVQCSKCSDPVHWVKSTNSDGGFWRHRFIPGRILDHFGEVAGSEGCHPFEAEYQGESDAKRRLPNCKACGRPATHAVHDGDVRPQVRELRNLLAGQRAAVEDPHDSPLHHPYRLGHDLPSPDGA